MVRFSPSIEQQKHFIIAKLMIWVWCGVAIMNRRLLTNHLHGKAAENSNMFVAYMGITE